MGRKLPHVLHDDEPERLLHQTANQRDRLLLMLGLHMGLRVSEISKLEIPHIDMRRRMLFVRAGKGDKDRALPVPAHLVRPLRGFVGARRKGYVFLSRKGNRLSVRRIQCLIKQLALKAGITDADKPRTVTPHKLRHAFCTRMLDAGVPIHQVRDLMGHSSVAVTDVYSHSSPEHLREAIETPYR